MNKILGEKFFNRDTRIVAKELLGKFLVRKIGGKNISVIITQTEAYDGFNDRASHAFRGKTKRTQVMFGKSGIFYVYLCYGMYYMLNIVTREKNYPAAVLIRGAKSDDLNISLNGPGKITKFLKIDKKLNGVDVCESNELWVEDSKERPAKVKKGKRIGVDYAGKWKDKLWRFRVD